MTFGDKISGIDEYIVILPSSDASYVIYILYD